MAYVAQCAAGRRKVWNKRFGNIRVEAGDTGVTASARSGGCSGVASRVLTHVAPPADQPTESSHQCSGGRTLRRARSILSRYLGSARASRAVGDWPRVLSRGDSEDEPPRVGWPGTCTGSARGGHWLRLRRHGTDCGGNLWSERARPDVSAAQKCFADQQTVGRGSVKILVRDWKEAAFDDGSSDAMVALESLEHFADKAGFARMARAAVRPGGRLAVTTWLAAEQVSPWSRRHLLDAVSREGSAAPLVTACEICEVFAAAGFSEVLAADLSPQVARTWGVILRRLALRLLTRPDYWAFLRRSRAQDRVFALTALRIRLAYRTGCFRYGYFVWE